MNTLVILPSSKQQRPHTVSFKERKKKTLSLSKTKQLIKA